MWNRKATSLIQPKDDSRIERDICNKKAMFKRNKIKAEGAVSESVTR